MQICRFVNKIEIWGENLVSFKLSIKHSSKHLAKELPFLPCRYKKSLVQSKALSYQFIINSDLYLRINIFRYIYLPGNVKKILINGNSIFFAFANLF